MAQSYMAVCLDARSDGNHTQPQVDKTYQEKRQTIFCFYELESLYSKKFYHYEIMKSTVF